MIKSSVCRLNVPITVQAGLRVRQLALHSIRSDGCIASRGGRGAPARSAGDLTPGEAMTRAEIRSDRPPAGGRIPGYAGAPARRLERVLRSRAALTNTNPAPAPVILVRNAG